MKLEYVKHYFETKCYGYTSNNRRVLLTPKNYTYVEKLELRLLSDLNPKGEDIFKDNTEVIELIKKKGLLYRDFEYLLKRHFDVFGLIEKGLAIDKNKINGNS